VKKSQTLGGRNSFRDVLLSGTRCEGSVLRCSFVVHHQTDFSLLIGFHVSARKWSAVRRNHLKRLMREAFRHVSADLSMALEQKHAAVSLVCSFKGSSDLPVRNVSLPYVRRDMQTFVDAIMLAV
jgi:ribonuclease P protein component